jgi:hypothetical protein
MFGALGKFLILVVGTKRISLYLPKSLWVCSWISAKPFSASLCASLVMKLILFTLSLSLESLIPG